KRPEPADTSRNRALCSHRHRHIHCGYGGCDGTLSLGGRDGGVCRWFCATGFIRGFAIIFVSWLLYAGVFRAISLLFRGAGSFKRCLEFVGYGFIPAIFAAVIELATMMVAYPKIDLASVDPGLMMQTLLQDPLMQASDIAGVLLLLWSAIIWIFGVKHAYNLSRRTATVVVVLPVAVYLLYSTVIII
ncbi:MAG: YIP1 family protein, partial [Methanosarcinales archaeon]|nr:YIP1 family protein [Methanosarcinales archaeon]